MNLEQFKDNLVKKDWFKDIDVKNNKIFVYVSSLNKECLLQDVIPDFIDDKQVLVHFDLAKKQCVDELSPELDEILEFELDNSIDEELLVSGILDVKNSGLSKNILESIFFEIHDGDNRITNFGEKNLEVKEKIQNLYNKFGFDLVFTQLDLNDA